MFQNHFIWVTFSQQNDAAHITQHKMFHKVQNWKRTMSMENPKHIYSDLQQIQSNGTIKDAPRVFKACYDCGSF